MVEGRADDRSKKSSRREYVIRNRPRHTATDRCRSDSARALSSPLSQHRRTYRIRCKIQLRYFPCRKFIICYSYDTIKIGRSKSLKSLLLKNNEDCSNSNGYTTGFFTVCQEALARRARVVLVRCMLK
ncbi:hypothetical protein X777_01458 [Ooceraea biroi]|uniref:Uncharacterized protein n=1 Tax=Ooceraea biroi TaxID=2015173 RepID=A0A026WPU3_OOCBI|nr:hypothetical protein X777_01458 [Ooceraea biroi]